MHKAEGAIYFIVPMSYLIIMASTKVAKLVMLIFLKKNIVCFIGLVLILFVQ